MRKNKLIYTLSALMMACIISFSGVGGTYLHVEATSVGIEPGVWNDDVSVWENISRYLDLFCSYSGLFINPVGFALNQQDFYNFMISDGVSHENAHGVFCDCDDSTHTSFSGNEHGGGGFVRDGISVDDDGNLTYSDEVSDLFHGFIKNYLDENCGYILFKTLPYTSVDVSFFTSEEAYNNFLTTANNFDIFWLWMRSFNEVYMCCIPTNNLYISNSFDDLYYVDGALSSSSTFKNFILFDVLEDDWSYHKPYLYNFEDNPAIDFTERHYVFSDFTLGAEHTTSQLHFVNDGNFRAVVSKDSRVIKVWNDLSAFKKYDVGQQPYYVTQNWLNYNSADDNSITLTQQEYQYYTDNSTTIYQTIQNNIDNSGDSDLTEKDVQDIVDDAVDKIKDEINNNSGSGDSGNGSTSDNDSGGTGVGDLIEGIGKIFDTILSLIGKLMGVVADFTQSILDLFSGFTTFTDGFSDFLAGAFSFIPAEVWDIIKVGLSLMVLLAVIKFLRK